MSDTITRVHDGLRAGTRCPVELLETRIARIEALDSKINAFSELDLPGARAAAANSKARFAAGEPLGPLDGIPVAVKANIGMRGMALHAGIAGRRHITASADSHAVSRLRAAGALLVGTTNMDEAALSATGSSPGFGQTLNPHDPGRSAGGSSGGSAAAVVSGMVLASLGTDALGSGRIPASLSGCTGFRPSKNLVSTDGCVPVSFTFDTVSPMAGCADDAFHILAALLGIPLDTDKLPDSVAGMHFGVPRDLIEATPHMASETMAAFDAALDTLKELGASVREVSLPFSQAETARKAAFLICMTEAAEYHGTMIQQNPEGFSERTRKLLEYGMALGDPEKLKLATIVAEAGDRLAEILLGADAILTPTTPFPAGETGAEPPESIANFTALAGMTATPALSVPMQIPGGLPALPQGLQIITDSLQERKAVTIARAYEKARGPLL